MREKRPTFVQADFHAPTAAALEIRDRCAELVWTWNQKESARRLEFGMDVVVEPEIRDGGDGRAYVSIWSSRGDADDVADIVSEVFARHDVRTPAVIHAWAEGDTPDARALVVGPKRIMTLTIEEAAENAAKEMERSLREGEHGNHQTM